MPVLELCSQSTMDTDNRAATPERLVNRYAEPLPQGGFARYVLKPVLGTETFATLDGVFMRALDMVPNAAGTERLFAAINGRLWRIDEAGSSGNLAAITDSAETTIAGNYANVCVAAGGDYRVWNGSTLLSPTPGAFSDFGSVDQIAGYTVLTERNGKRFQWSALADATTLPGLSFATADGRDDNIIRAVAIDRNLWIFKQRSIEVWGLTGAAGADAFQRITVLESGLKAFGLLTKLPGGTFFVGDDGICYLAIGGQLQPAISGAVQTAIQDGTPTHCGYYEDEGHKICVLRFSGRPAWCLDVTTGKWHERASGEDGAWNATAWARAFGSWHIGLTGGAVETLTRNGVDADGPLYRRIVSTPFYGAGRAGRIREIVLNGRVGFSSLGRNAELILRTSRDGGITFEGSRTVSMGDLGDYDTQIAMRSFGKLDRLAPFVLEIRDSDPTDLQLASAGMMELV